MIHHSSPFLDNEDYTSVLSALKSNYLTRGKITEEFEKEFANFHGGGFCRVTSSGSCALQLALLALGIKDNDEVILPSYLCSAVLNAVVSAGGSPVIVDVDSDTYNITIDTIKRKLTSNTKCIVIPHILGMPADVKSILEIGLPVIEDAAQAIGAIIEGKPVGSFAPISIFSFYATKVMTTGTGGMILCKDIELYNKILDLAEYDNREDWKLRFSFDINEYQSALGLSQLRRLPLMLNRRKEIAKRYFSILEPLLGKSILKLPPNYEGHIYFRFMIETNKSVNDAAKVLAKFDVEAKRPVYMPIHRYLNLPIEEYLVSERIHNQGISIPIYPALSDEQADIVVNALEKAF